MKKIFVLLMTMLLVLGLVACGGPKTPETSAPTVPSTAPTTVPTEPTTVPTTAPTEPARNTTVGGVDLSALTVEEATAALNEAAASYRLALKVNGKTLNVAAADLGLKLDEAALKQYIDAIGTGAALPGALFTYDRAALKSVISRGLDTAPVNATVTYNSSKKQFEANAGKNGTKVDADAAADAAAASLGMLLADAEAQVKTTEVAPEINASSEKVTKAISKANGYLKVSLSYTYAPEGGEKATETISAAKLASFVKISDKLEVSVSKSAIESYCATMGDRHNGADYKGSFKTTNGGTTGQTVTYYGQRVNKSALADDIYKCVTEQVSGTRTAPYSAKSSKPYGGSYVEIDLSSQKLWLYKNGERIISTSFVSGSVAEGHRTPTGIYSIYSKQTDRYLTGANYRSFVHYWMPFLGGYGLHDASWRSSFGGTIYYYDGSHGCVNLPSSAAKTIYNNVSVGTKVILYGGKTEVPDLEQQLSGTTSYTVERDAKSFKLDVKAKYKGATLSYASSDTNVVTVSSNGTVTVKGVGTATITVTAAPFDFYTGAELKVTITVQDSGATQPTDPKPTEPSEPTEPKPTEPTEPKPTEPTEPKPTEPSEPQPTEPTEPKPTEPQPTEPKPTEPAPTEPKPTEPAPTDPEPTEPVSEPAE